MKKCFFVFLILLCGSVSAISQTMKIKGSVISSSDRQPITGASVWVKGTSIGTMSDRHGEFSLQLPDSSCVLVISFIGMKTRELVSEPEMKIMLEPDEQFLDEIVVTAVGIERSQKSLGYATTKIFGDELIQAREDNLLNALAGKVAGVRVISSSGTLGGSSKIQIRGVSSIVSAGSPLFIVDGMPIDNSSYDPGNLIGIVDGGNRAGDLSVDDIESVNVLKGAAATALYGAKAKDGAIIITTRRGGKSSGISILVNSSTRFERVLKLPDFQNEYAQGTGGIYNVEAYDGWGPNIAEEKAAGKKYTDRNGNEVTLRAYPDNIKDFFQTGISYINNISFSGGGESADFRMGISSYNQTGVIPGSEYNRYTLSLNTGAEITTGFSGRITAQYIRNDSEGRQSQGSNDASLLISGLYLMPRTIDMHELKRNWIDQEGKQIPVAPSGTNNNPYWVVNRNKATGSLDRIVGNMLLTYTPLAGLTISNNIGIDYYNEKNRKVYSKGTVGSQEGKFQDGDVVNRLVNNDLMISYQKELGDIVFKGIVGYNLYQNERSNKSTLASQLVVDELYAYANAKSTITTNYSELKRLTGVYFDFGVSYRNMVFLNVTGRNDWSSTLPLNNRSYFYPSVSGSFVFSELLDNRDILNFGKIRLNYASVGSDTEPYQLKFQYRPVSSYYFQYGLESSYPRDGMLGFAGPVRLPQENLKPQNQRAFEVGGEFIFFNNRIHLDFTYYHNVTVNQIVAVTVPSSTGYYQNVINAGKLTNRGVEIALNLTPVRTKDFTWNLNLNFASNKQIVKEITDDLSLYTLTNIFDMTTISAEKGKSFGFYGTGWLRDEQGNYVINEATGLRETENGVRLGNLFPDFTLGVNNRFAYKGLNLSFLLDIRQGGKMYSGTVAKLRNFGLAAETAKGRGETFIEPGVILNADGTSRPNDVPVKDMETYWSHIGNTENGASLIFEASYVKLRELVLAYQLPRGWFVNCFIKSLSIGFEGRNLWLIKSHVPHIDPEVNLTGPNSFGEGVEYFSIPSTRSFGFNLKLNI